MVNTNKTELNELNIVSEELETFKASRSCVKNIKDCCEEHDDLLQKTKPGCARNSN